MFSRSTLIYASIAGLVLYGDLIKVVAAPTIALWLLYAIAAVTLVALATLHSRGDATLVTRSGAAVYRACAILVALYVAQVLTTLDAPITKGAVHAAYVSIPLAYVIVVQRFSSGFELRRLASTFLWMMIPVNIVGWIQYFVEPSFLVSTTYSSTGGVISRNMFGMVHFQRYPSIFASADRYSAMGLMHLYFALVTLRDASARGTRRTIWILLNIAAASSALLIAGARSRIIIAGVLFATALAALVIRGMRASPRRVNRTANRRVLAGITATVVVVPLGLAVLAFDWPGEMFEFPVVEFLADSFRHGDVETRVEEAAVVSALPDTITYFGEGLGTQGDGGKPGEFGIAAIWRESGLVWGIALISAFVSIIVVLGIGTVRAAAQGRGLDAVLHAMPMLLLMFGLAAGLTSAFELSSGVLLGCIIGSITRGSRASQTRRSVAAARKAIDGPAIAV